MVVKIGSTSCTILLMRATTAALPISEMSDSTRPSGPPISEALFGLIIEGESGSNSIMICQISVIGVISPISAFPSEKRRSSDSTFFLKSALGIRSMVSR